MEAGMTEIKVLNLVADSSKGGAQKVALQLNELINISGNESEVVFLDKVGDDYSAYGTLSPLNFFQKLTATLKTYFWVLRAKTNGKFDVVISHIDRADWFNAHTNLFFKGKSVIYCHGSKVADTNYHGFSGYLRRQLTYRSYRRVDAIICVSLGLEQELINTGVAQSNKLITIYNWIDSATIHQMADETLEPAFAKLATTKRKVFVISSRLSEQKDIPTILYAYAQADFAETPLLLIIGGGEEYDHLLAIAKQSQKAVCRIGDVPDPDLHDIIFVGFQENPFQFVALAETVLSSSIWEGFSLSILEALLLGRRVVANDCPHGPKELVSLANQSSTSSSTHSHAQLSTIPLRDGLSDLSSWVDALEHCAATKAELPTNMEAFQQIFSPETARQNIDSFLLKLVSDK
jgi:glycosyltransferase involved in cell wall biosynthesis